MFNRHHKRLELVENRTSYNMVFLRQGIIFAGFVFLFLNNTLCAQDAAAPANGQAEGKYQTLPVYPTLAGDTPQSKKLRADVAYTIHRMLRGSLKLEDESNEIKFDAWYTQYVFATMTQVQPEILARLDEHRQKFIKNDLASRLEKSVRDHLLELTLKQMKTIVRENYHPAVRYNAMLIIADLDETEIRKPGKPVPTKPSLHALKAMLDELQNEKQIDAVRLAAWTGVLRHVNLHRKNLKSNPMGPQIPPEGVEIIRKVASDLLMQKRPAERRLDCHEWMQHRASEVLIALDAVGVDKNVQAEVDKIAKGPYVPSCDLQLPGGKSITASIYPTAIVAVPRDIEKLKEEQQKAITDLAKTTDAINNENPQLTRVERKKKLDVVLEGTPIKVRSLMLFRYCEGLAHLKLGLNAYGNFGSLSDDFPEDYRFAKALIYSTLKEEGGNDAAKEMWVLFGQAEEALTTSKNETQKQAAREFQFWLVQVSEVCLLRTEMKVPLRRLVNHERYKQLKIQKAEEIQAFIDDVKARQTKLRFAKVMDLDKKIAQGKRVLADKLKQLNIETTVADYNKAMAEMNLHAGQEFLKFRLCKRSFVTVDINKRLTAKCRDGDCAHQVEVFVDPLSISKPMRAGFEGRRLVVFFNDLVTGARRVYVVYKPTEGKALVDETAYQKFERCASESLRFKPIILRVKRASEQIAQIKKELALFLLNFSRDYADALAADVGLSAEVKQFRNEIEGLGRELVKGEENLAVEKKSDARHLYAIGSEVASLIPFSIDDELKKIAKP